MAVLELRELVLDSAAGKGGPVSLTLHSGQLLAVQPRPAAGGDKHTAARMGTAFARAVVGLGTFRSGTIVVDGQEVTSDVPPGRRRIGYVPDGGALLPQLTVRENIRYGGLTKPAVDTVLAGWVQDFVDKLQLNRVDQLRPHQISPAQRLRTALARAAVGWPAALVVDLPEAFGGAEEIGELVAAVNVLYQPKPSLAVLVCSAEPAILTAIGSRVELPVEEPQR